MFSPVSLPNRDPNSRQWRPAQTHRADPTEFAEASVHLRVPAIFRPEVAFELQATLNTHKNGVDFVRELPAGCAEIP
jgi:hypothetical protein